MESLRHSDLVCIFVIFVAGNAEVRRNEQADSLAGTAVNSDSRATDHANVLHAVNEAERVEDSLGDEESNKRVERLRDGQVKLSGESDENLYCESPH
jgi:hypothetical protein